MKTRSSHIEFHLMKVLLQWGLGDTLRERLLRQNSISKARRRDQAARVKTELLRCTLPVHMKMSLPITIQVRKTETSPTSLPPFIRVQPREADATPTSLILRETGSSITKAVESTALHQKTRSETRWNQLFISTRLKKTKAQRLKKRSIALVHRKMEAKQG